MSGDPLRFFKFAAVGGSGVLVNLAVVWLAGQMWPGSDRLAIVCGIVVSIFTNFVINDLWTWGDRDKGGVSDWFRRCALFFVTNGIAAILQFLVAMGALSLLQFETWPLGLPGDLVRAPLASLIGIAVATPINFVVNNRLTFREGQDPS